MWISNDAVSKESVSKNAVPVPGVATRVAPRVEWLLAPNAGAWTFEGTNTWIVGEPDADACAVIDPGPKDADHIESLLRVIGRRSVSYVVLTHGHNDHEGAASGIVDATGARIVKARKEMSHSNFPDELDDGIEVRLLPTPGHTRDSLCVYLPADRIVFTGDTLLGSGSPVVHPELLREMLDSLRTLRALGASTAVTALPGHGPVVADLAASADRRLNARNRRIRQVRDLLSEREMSIDELVTRMYPEVEHPDVLSAARSSILAMVTYLNEESALGRTVLQDDAR
ncbi:MBL fold metallo-hydrolase [Rhodococcus sp. RS1C4]|uniref:MBL fold metallo-hydrolase n=1 Tax=Nocardiaceae TaxID=85025 RepID=UPI0003714859|nr:MULTISPECIES: MBL fold metallo-hydrolase [Rhodococcus]OZC46768.1 MBL fold metallo-hydrolase [Rhodococcus sp. 06-621-2]OZC52916.1 MBL fold metallo-hydrolase [Rhodococcus sp. RS1C4]OZC77452.1 MBL fold metallo-hydrolase [Rhodococcus sp. 06-418-1B]OZC77736.1 MBL fold metallo-hydrolase [Rhodococcus sp. 06-418-1B]OZD14875.1 MBL fold metallo-hydrolase [Rhodococcus sp. 06-156-4C]